MSTQGFQKGNRLGAKGAKARKEAQDSLWAFLANGGRDAYQKKLAKLEGGKEISKPEQEFMDRTERLFPYVKPKLSYVESKTEHQFEGVSSEELRERAAEFIAGVVGDTEGT